MARFNEALDQALAESVARYAAMVKQSRDIFLGVLGHDLRTPLQAMSLGAEFLMRTGDVDRKLVQLGSRMFASTSRMQEIVENLLDFTKSRVSGALEIHPEPTNLALICEQIVEEFRFSNPDRTIISEINGDVSGVWDSGRVGQVYQNLISNALQYGYRDSEVNVSTEGTVSDVRITVMNYGDPIPKEVQKHLFDPLQRYADSGIGGEFTARKNLGLGLYIVREIVSAHGGNITVFSSSERTSFVVQLPKG
jgi:signal transduction histidine kinase